MSQHARHYCQAEFHTPPFNNIQENAKRMITVWAGKTDYEEATLS